VERAGPASRGRDLRGGQGAQRDAGKTNPTAESMATTGS